MESLSMGMNKTLQLQRLYKPLGPLALFSFLTVAGLTAAQAEGLPNFFTEGLSATAASKGAASKCRIWIQDRILDARPQLEKTLSEKSYIVSRLNAPPAIQTMNRLYDIALYPGPNGKTHTYLTLNMQVLADLGETNFAPEKLPSCAMLPSAADETYFKAYFGRLARERLNGFYQSRTLRPGIGALFLQAEALKIHGFRSFQAEFKKILPDYQELVRQVRDIWNSNAAEPDIKKRLDAVRELLLPFYANYRIEQPLLTFGLQGPMVGNCQVSTQVLLFTMIDAGINLGPDWQLGAQLFNDHIQPVVYNQKEDRLYELVNGKRVLFKAPVYSPELLTYGLARSAGPGIPDERESALRIRKIDYAYASKMDWIKYWIFDQRSEPGLTWRNPFYLVYDPAFSWAGTGSPPQAGTISYRAMSEDLMENPFSELKTEPGGAEDEGSLSNLAELFEKFPVLEVLNNDALGKKISEAKLKDLVARLEPVKSKLRAGGGNIGTSKVGIPLNFPEAAIPYAIAKYWAAYPESERPEAGVARSETLAAIGFDNNRKDFYLNSKVYSAAAKLGDLKKFKSDLQILVEPTDIPETETKIIWTTGTKIQIFHKPYRILVRSSRLLADIKAAQGSGTEQTVIEGYLKKMIRAKFSALDKKTPTELYAFLLRAGPAPSLSALKKSEVQMRDFIEAISPQMSMNNVSTFDPKDTSYCDYRKGLKRNSILSPEQIESSLRRLKTLDPETHTAFFRLLAVLEQNNDLMLNLGYCEDKGRDSLSDQILKRLVLNQLERRDQKMLKPLSLIYPKFVLAEVDQKVARPKDPLTGKSLQQGQVTPDLNTQKPNPTEVNELQPETLMGLLFAADRQTLENPMVQIVALKWLTADNLISIANNWPKEPLAINSIYTLLDFSPLMQERVWMNDVLKLPLQELEQNARAFLTYERAESASAPISAALKTYLTQNPVTEVGSYRLSERPVVKSLGSTRNIFVQDVQNSCNSRSTSIQENSDDAPVTEEIFNRSSIMLSQFAGAICPQGSYSKSNPPPRTFWKISLYQFDAGTQQLTTRTAQVKKVGEILNLEFSDEIKSAAELRALMAAEKAP